MLRAGRRSPKAIFLFVFFCSAFVHDDQPRRFTLLPVNQGRFTSFGFYPDFIRYPPLFFFASLSSTTTAWRRSQIQKKKIHLASHPVPHPIPRSHANKQRGFTQIESLGAWHFLERKSKQKNAAENRSKTDRFQEKLVSTRPAWRKKKRFEQTNRFEKNPFQAKLLENKTD